MAPQPTPRSDHLARLGIVEYDTDLRTWSAEAITAAHGARRSGRLVLSRLVRNLLWQVHQRIAAGVEPPVRGNIRTLWYRWLKPILARQPRWNQRLDKGWQQFIDTFSELVVDERLFDYADFGLADENWENRRMGHLRPHVLVFAEKKGWMRFLRGVHRDLGVSVLALGGAPSALTSEYTARHLREALGVAPGGPMPRLHLISIVDHDPTGVIIARAFVDQLAAFGLVDTTLSAVIEPGNFDEAELATLALPMEGRRGVEAWMAAGGGIGGEALGLAAEALPWERARRLVEAAVREVAPEPLIRAHPPWRVSLPAWQATVVAPRPGRDVVVEASADESLRAALEALEREEGAVVWRGGEPVAGLGRLMVG